MKTSIKKTASVVAAGAALALLLTAGGCGEAASKTASENVSTKADNFEVQRKIVGINTRTDKYLFYVEGRCSIERQGDLIVICKYSDDDYRKHIIGQATDVAWVTTQEEPIKVSEYHTLVVLKPEGIIPDLELNLSK